MLSKMKKLFQNKSFLKSIQVFLVCLVVLGGVGSAKNVEAEEILIYAGTNLYAGFFDISPNLSGGMVDGITFNITIKERIGIGEIGYGVGAVDLSNYDQFWLLDCAGSSQLFNASELAAIASFRSAGKRILLSADDDILLMPKVELVNQVASHLGLGLTFFGSLSIATHCAIPVITVWAGHPVAHPIWSYPHIVTRSSGSSSDAEISITDSNITVEAMFGSDDYGAVLDKIGEPRVIFDPSFAKFFIDVTGCGSIINYNIQENMAVWLAVSPPPTCTLTAAPNAIIAGGSSNLAWLSTNADSVVSSNFGAATINGNDTLSPAATITYTLTVTNTAGDTDTCSAIVTVTAFVPPPPPPLCDPRLGLFCNPLASKTNSIAEGITLVALYLLSLVGIITLAFMVIAGIRYIISAGNPEKMKSAKDALFSAGYGLAIIVLAYTILSIIYGILSA